MIGIDPSARTSGTGVCVINGRYVSFAPNMPNLDAVLQWLEHEAPNPARVVIENSNLQNTSFIMQGSKAAVAKIARNVGRNQEASQAIVDAARRIFGEQSVTEISPKQKGSKWCQKTADGVAQSLGHTLPKRMSQDKRDAYMLAVRKVK
ncbi:hypothetical protein [Neolewinella maritima]|uniref:hypothetical protein n=1 Tax=Neolewinella maritima TaxID=1383882 RepID=UPI001EE8EA8A|nr:hypothetical protein [Neolewinella maritima]